MDPSRINWQHVVSEMRKEGPRFGGLRGSIGLETMILQIAHLCTLRSKAQFLTGIPAAISAITNGNFHLVCVGLLEEFGDMLCDDDEAGKEEAARMADSPMGPSDGHRTGRSLGCE